MRAPGAAARRGSARRLRLAGATPAARRPPRPPPRCAARRRRSPRVHRQASELLAGGVRRLRGAPAGAARLPGRRHAVVVVVRGLRGRPRRLPERSRRSSAAASRSSAIDVDDSAGAAHQALRQHPVSFPSYLDHEPRDRLRALAGVEPVRADHLLLPARRRRSPRSTPARSRASPSCAARSGPTPVSEIRVDPLSGLRTIVAPDRAQPRRRPARPLRRGQRGADAARALRDPPRRRRARHARAGGCASFANRFPALDDATREPIGRDARPDLFTARPRRGRPRGDRQLAAAGRRRSRELEPDELALAVEVWRERMRAHPQAACAAPVRQRGRAPAAPRAPHTHAQLLALDFVPALIARERERFGAYADAHDGPAAARRPRRRGGAPPRARRGDRRRGGAARPVRLDRRLPADARAAPPAPALRGRRRRPARRCCTTRCAASRRRFGESPPLNLWIRTAPRGAEQFCWRIDIVPRLERASPGSSWAAACTWRPSRPSAPPRSCATA